MRSGKRPAQNPGIGGSWSCLRRSQTSRMLAHPELEEYRLPWGCIGGGGGGGGEGSGEA